MSTTEALIEDIVNDALTGIPEEGTVEVDVDDLRILSERLARSSVVCSQLAELAQVNKDQHLASYAAGMYDALIFITTGVTPLDGQQP